MLVGNNGATNALTVLNNGNVGIGTASPQGKLDITSTDTTPGLMVRGTTAGNNPVYITSAGYGPVIGTEGTAGTYYSFGVSSGVTPNANGFTGGTLRFVVKDNGNVGIGTATPNEPLHIKTNETGAGTSLFRLENSGTLGSEVGMEFYTTPTDSTSGTRTGRIYGVWDNGSYSGARLTLQSMASGNILVDTMTLKNGNVGIGTTTPSQKLDVAGNININSGSKYLYNGVQIAQAQTALNNYYFGGAGNLTGTGSYNTANGYASLISNTTGSNNTASGYVSLYSNTTGSQNTANGYTSLYSNTTGNYNTANGMNSLFEIGLAQTAGAFNIGTSYTIATVGTTNFTLIGASANTVGIVFTATGVGAGTGTATPNGTNNNTALGYSAGRGIIYGTGNTILGANVTGLAAGLTNNIILANGTGAIKAQNDGTNWNFTGNVGIGITPTAVLHLKAGTATANTAPFKFTSGVNLTTPEAGAMEFDGTHFYGSIGTTRYQLDQQVGGGATVGYTFQVGTFQGNPVDATTYYITAGGGINSTTTSIGATRFYIPKTGTLKTAYGVVLVGGTLGTTESTTVRLRLNNTTNIDVSTVLDLSVASVPFNNSGLSQAVTAGDYIEVQFITPTWTTNPTNVSMSLSFYIE